MSARLNFTGRRRIKRDNVQLAVHRDDNGIQVTLARLELDGLNLDSSAEIFVEIYHQTYFQRTQCGTVGDPSVPATWSIDDFPAPELLRSRIKVVAKVAHGGRILAVGDRIPVSATGSLGQSEGLLPIAPADLGARLWRIDVSDSPQILINSRAADWKAAAQEPWFVTLVYPEALRRAAQWAYEECRKDPDDVDPALRAWLQYFKERFAVDVEEQAQESLDVDDWAEELADEFSSEFRLDRLWLPLVSSEEEGQ